MSATVTRLPHPLGVHRVIDPPGAMPQNAWRIDNTPAAGPNELLCDVETLNIDSASFQQMKEATAADAGAVAELILRNVRERGKQHNSVTGSGGMFVGRVATVGSALRARSPLREGDRIASLVSLTLTPLHIEAIERIDLATGRVWMRGQAILFESSLWAKLPEDITQDVALAVLDVAGAPAQVGRMTAAGMTVVIIGADGKSGLLSCAQASSHGARVVGVVPDRSSEGARLLLDAHLVAELVECDARDTLELAARVAQATPQLADLTVNCVNVGGTELGSILCTKDRGTVYFFSMATSFTAAALGAEGVAKDVTMIVGNGYAAGHAETALQTLRDFPQLHTYFTRRYAAE